MNPHLVNKLMSRHIINCLHQHQAHTPLIGPVSDHTGSSLKTEGTVLLQSLKELLKLAVDEYQYDIVFMIFLKFLGDRAICSAFLVQTGLFTDPHLIHLLLHSPPLLFYTVTNGWRTGAAMTRTPSSSCARYPLISSAKIYSSP